MFIAVVISPLHFLATTKGLRLFYFSHVGAVQENCWNFYHSLPREVYFVAIGCSRRPKRTALVWRMFWDTKKPRKASMNRKRNISFEGEKRDATA